MLLDLGQKKPQGTAQNGAAIFDVGTEEFEDKVMKASETMPILVDFWAPWCGPCKQLMPVLEKIVQGAGGKIKLAKVNIDEHPELAQAMRVQSVPMVFAFYGGQPVTGFNGVRPESEIKSLVDQLIQMAAQNQPESIDIAETLKAAAAALSEGQAEMAQELYAMVLTQDENNAAAFAGLARTFIAMNMLEDAQALLDELPPEVAKDSAIDAARTALKLAQEAPAGDMAVLAQAVEKNPGDLQARYDYAQALFAAGQRAAAMDMLLEIIRRDRGWEDEKARTQLLQYFEALGAADPDVMAGRRKLSTVLFS